MIQRAGENIVDEPFAGCKVALFIGDALVAILRDDDRDILYPNMWDLPGGGREDRETPIETVRREVLEELGLVVPKHAFVWQRAYPAAYDLTKRVWFFVAQLPQGEEAEITFGDEGQRWALMEPATLFAQPNVIASYQSRLADWHQSKMPPAL